ncbi:thioredoxin-like protein [Phyllosticta citribraziliensis]|uniref:thioredoxin-dependent peroxiredoxin n=1 Tax=Phyllosticta citribraziliensis TaxID=989973 RepID=A0ABR1LAN7_9PEZI
MVELRKRKTPPPAPEKPNKKKPGPKTAAKGSKAKPAAAPEPVDNTPAPKVEPAKESNATATNGAKSSGKPEVGKTIELEGFGGEIETNDGDKTTLKQLADDSKAGVVLFTYPKASTPGCTKQACLFRDAYAPLTATGLAIYGLSADSPKSNTTFKTKQNLPYPLLCDPSFSLIKAIGLAKPGNAKGTVRGVFVVDKAGKVLAAEAGGPDATVEVVRKIVGAGDAAGDADGDDKAAEKEGNGEDVKADGEAK